MKRTINLDNLLAESENEKIEIIFQGETLYLPASIPAKVMFLIMRKKDLYMKMAIVKSKLDSGIELTQEDKEILNDSSVENEVEQFAVAYLGKDIFEKLLDKGISMDQFNELLIKLGRMYGVSEAEDEVEEQPKNARKPRTKKTE